jgi:hypothetical protein
MTGDVDTLNSSQVDSIPHGDFLADFLKLFPRLRMEHQAKHRLCAGSGRESLNAFGENRRPCLDLEYERGLNLLNEREGQ